MVAKVRPNPDPSKDMPPESQGEWPSEPTTEAEFLAELRDLRVQVQLLTADNAVLVATIRELMELNGYHRARAVLSQEHPGAAILGHLETLDHLRGELSHMGNWQHSAKRHPGLFHECKVASCARIVAALVAAGG